MTRDTAEHFAISLTDRKLRCNVHEAGNDRGEARKDVNIPEDEFTRRSQTTLVVVREKFRLVSGHIYAHGAIAFASFAGEAQVQRFLDSFVLPAVADTSPWVISQSNARARG